MGCCKLCGCEYGLSFKERGECTQGDSEIGKSATATTDPEGIGEGMRLLSPWFQEILLMPMVSGMAWSPLWAQKGRLPPQWQKKEKEHESIILKP